MVKIERKNSDKVQKAIDSLKYQKVKGGTFNTEEVNEALREVFHCKCYICEDKGATSYQIEHLIPHKEEITLKYDWNNLFLACAHCNNSKLSGFDPILDCTKTKVDLLIAFRKKGEFGKEESLEFEPLERNEEIDNTVRLLYKVFKGDTPQKKFEARILRTKVMTEISKFETFVRKYDTAEGEDKKDLKEAIKRELKENSSFAAFKRWRLREATKYREELKECLPY